MYLPLSRASPFPVINSIDDMRSRLAHKEEIRFMEQPNGTTVCSYLISGPETFDCPYAREARGIVFGANGRVLARPLNKFFNLNERPETQLDALQGRKVARLMDKRDGSMIHTVELDGDLARTFDRSLEVSDEACFVFKSKKSFTSDVVKVAIKHLQRDPITLSRYVRFCNARVSAGETAIFEITSPVARIVLPYAEDELRLLHVRNNVTGVYHTSVELHQLAAAYGIPVVEEKLFDEGDVLGALSASAQVLGDIEGWVVQFADGDMVKVKTRWYMERHKAMTFLRVRDIALLSLHEELDDLKALLVGDGIDIAPILEVESQVVAKIDAILHEVEAVYAPDKDLTRKDFAVKHQGHPFFSLLMKRFSGAEPNVKEYYERVLLKEDFDLMQLNLLQTVAEAE